MYTLVKFEANWADELTVYGFAIFKYGQWDERVRVFKEPFAYENTPYEEIPEHIKIPRESWYFGSNEGFDDIRNPEQYWLNNYEIRSISVEEAKFLVSMFDMYGDEKTGWTYGNFCDLIQD